MFITYVNHFFLIASLFLLLFSALKTYQAYKAFTGKVDSLPLYLLLFSSTVAIAFISGLLLLGSLPVDAYPFLLFPFCISLLLAGCTRIISKCVSVIVEFKELGIIDTTDQLTGVYNRHYLDLNLRSEIERSQRFSSPLAVITINLQDFYTHATVYGFQSAERILKTAASAIVSSVRESDVVARYDTSCFIVVLKAIPESEIRTVTNRLESNLKDSLQSFGDIMEGVDYSNVTFGKACCDVNTRTGEELIATALEQFKIEKCSLNKEDTVILLENGHTEKPLEQAA